MNMETLEIECPTCHSEIVLTPYDNDQCSKCGKDFWGRYEDLFVERPDKWLAHLQDQARKAKQAEGYYDEDPTLGIQKGKSPGSSS